MLLEKKDKILLMIASWGAGLGCGAILYHLFQHII